MNTIANVLRNRSNLKLNLTQITRLSSNVSEEKIVIPKAIPRGPTDILRALESTVSRDPTATHYKYHDDPFLIPMSNMGKRTFAMAQEAGRKAAYWVREQHPDLFQHQEADPPIKPFFPKMVYSEDEVTEDTLKHVIDEVLIPDAKKIYKLMIEKGMEISKETQQALLDLLCFYNNEDTLSEEFIEERWFRNSAKEKVRKTWADGSLAEEIFISIENPDAAAYSAIIQGMAKHYQVNRAWQLFEEAQGKGLEVNTSTYNSIIRVTSFMKESYDLRWSFVNDILSLMNKAKTKPNLGTLNACLEIVSTMGQSKTAKSYALKLLKEFKSLGIEPSLASWYHVLMTYCKERGPVSTILNDILPHIENKEHTIRDIKDTFFFVTAMDICRNHLHDKDLAQRVNKLLHFGNNYNLIGDSYKESIYYRHYFIVLCETEPLDEFMENIYNKLVPHIYVPEPGVIAEVLKNIDMNSAVEYLPKIWSDMLIFDHTGRENLLNMVMNIMINHKPDESSELNDKFSKIAWGIWSKIENQNENRIQKLAFTGEMLGNIMIMVLRNNDFEKAFEVMQKLDKGMHSVVGVPKLDALSMFMDHCIKEKLPTTAIQCIQYLTDSGFPEAEDFAIRLNKSLTLDETHLGRLGKIVGEQFLQKKM
ncbi:PREDICTED: protein PTCD3 homolog, mitochondrial [Nicrophorus vespilloides]|uniref:Small ribosomal subunit protein mS39 n=1 Tax=Nicrophorus vespilloides TaxID=110193 RepID=A0ABM1MW90_NICVS|nr:PREDICTED: protein PTCD3 homolog, mitochondrial [Nicrophorus vespilloides]